MKITGHRRSFESLDSTNGAARVQRGGTVTCACGWAQGVGSREAGTEAHEAHKRDVANGRYGSAVCAETQRRADRYRMLLADPIRMAELTLTAEQVQEWLDELISGRMNVSV